MKICASKGDIVAEITAAKSSGKRIGFVPTMGYLHEGHLSLAREIRKHCDVVVASLFVNPLQFNETSDYEKYPIDHERDFDLLKREGIDIAFVPAVTDIYQENSQTRVLVTELSKPLEGKFRPGHFEGVTTVVAALFNLVRPDVAIFGEKDLQQLRVIEQMVRDLHFPIKIIRGAIVREVDGLAMSSRNVRLSAEARSKALLLSRSLKHARELVQAGESSAVKVIEEIEKLYKDQDSVKLEYFSVADEDTLDEVTELLPGRPYRALVAASIDGVRLIDNSSL